MPSLLDIGTSFAPPLVGAWLSRKAAGTATKALTTGADQAASTIQKSGTDVDALLKQIYADQQKKLNPYETAGTANLDRLNAGLAPGGGLADAWKPTNLEDDAGYKFRLQQGLKQIQAASNANGTRFSGGTLKAINNYAQESASQEAQAAFDRDQAQKQAIYNRIKGVTDLGSTATQADVTAASNYGSNAAHNQELTAQQLADLQTEKASALASGDVAKANAISTAIEQGVNALQQVGPAKDLAKYIKSLGGSVAAPAGSMASTVAAAGGGPALASTVPDIGAAISAAGGDSAMGLSSIGAAAPAGTTLSGYAGGGLVTSHGALIGTLTNPITLVAGAAILSTIAILKSQAHWEANTFTKNVQTPFGNNLVKAVDGFNQAAQSGKLDKATGEQLAQQIIQQLNDFEQARQQFATKGKDNKTVADQAKAEMDKDFGPNFSNLVNGLQSTVSRLA